MKKLKRIGISIIALAAMGMVACGSHSGNSGTVPSEVNTSTVTDKVTGISLDEENIQMDAGYTKQLTATVTPIGTTNNKVVWSSSDESVAVVDQTGLVTAVNLGDAIITAKTEVGNYQATCEVSVSGYHRSESVFKNIGKVENNSGYNQTNGNKNFTIDVSNEDYMTITFNRYETMEWGSLNCYYNKDEIKATEFVFEAELVKGKLPNCQFEFAGETDFKFYKRVPLEIGKRSSVSVNITDMNFVDGWGNIFLEPNNPGDPDDTNRQDTEQVELRIYKMHLIEGDKKAPEKIENLHFDTKSNKVMFNKNTASSEYEIEVYKVEGETKTKLEIDARQTRFNAVQVIPDMAISFTPKPDENFANVPGNYEVRVRGKNSAGEGEWSDVASFTIAGEEENKGYTSKGFLNDGLIEPNQYNQDTTFTSELKEDGYHLKFTGTDTNAWDSYALSFDKNGGYTSLHMEFEVLKGNLTEAQVEFCDWAPAEPEASDGKQQSAIQVTEGKNVVDVEITANLSLGNGQLALQFARQGAAIGECEILVTKIALSVANS